MEEYTIEKAVEDIINNKENPKTVKERLKLKCTDESYKNFLSSQRKTIEEENNKILSSIEVRKESAEKVAIAKYLAGDTLLKINIEHKIIKQAREEGQRFGLKPDDSEDIISIILTKARKAQEKIYDTIAFQTREVMIPECKDVKEKSMPPITIGGGTGPLTRELELIAEWRIMGLGDNDLNNKNTHHFLALFDSPHKYMKNGIIVGCREYISFDRALKKNKPVNIISGFAPLGPMHLGHGALIYLLKYYQDLGVKITIALSDIEAVVVGNKSRDEAKKIAIEEYLLNFATIGLDLEKADIYTQWKRQDVTNLAFELGGKISMMDIYKTFNPSFNNNITNVFFPVIQVADVLHLQLEKYYGKSNTLVICGIDQDPYMRIIRKVAKKAGFVQPSMLYMRFMKGLTSYKDKSTDEIMDRMSSSQPKTALFYTDSEKTIEEKINNAITGGAVTLEKQRKNGGNPDMRVCSLSSLMAFYVIEDKLEYEKLKQDCKDGKITCDECKKRCIDFMTKFIRDHQEKKEKIKDDILELIDRKNIFS